MFPGRPDVEALEELLERAVRRGPLEVHAYTVLTTHCHLLVRCPRERLSAALRNVFGSLGRRINKRLRREGPLFAGRGRIVPVTSVEHWRAVIAYIDRNAVEAAMASRPSAYPFSSAWHYARPSGPTWLRRDVVEEFVRRRTKSPGFTKEAYAKTFTCRTGKLSELAQRRAQTAVVELDPLDDLYPAAPEHVRRWLTGRARLADGLDAGPVVVGAQAILEAVDEQRVRLGDWTPGLDPTRPGRRVDGWRTIAAGLLRASSGMHLAEIGARLGLSLSGAYEHARRHGVLLGSDDEYAKRAGTVLSRALRRTFD